MWMKSSPFDIGTTTRKGLGPLLINCDPEVAKEGVRTKNPWSNSNGSMMRSTPMAVWASSLKDPKDLKLAICQDVEFTHRDESVKEAIFLYAAAI